MTNVIGEIQSPLGTKKSQQIRPLPIFSKYILFNILGLGPHTNDMIQNIVTRFNNIL